MYGVASQHVVDAETIKSFKARLDPGGWICTGKETYVLTEKSSTNFISSCQYQILYNKTVTAPHYMKQEILVTYIKPYWQKTTWWRAKKGPCPYIWARQPSYWVALHLCLTSISGLTNVSSFYQSKVRLS